MPGTRSVEAMSFPFPTRLRYERSGERLRVVVDAFPAAIDDVTAEVGTTRLRITVERDGEDYERTVSPPSHRHVFGGDHSAVYNNGVLSVSLETDARAR